MRVQKQICWRQIDKTNQEETNQNKGECKILQGKDSADTEGNVSMNMGQKKNLGSARILE